MNNIFKKIIIPNSPPNVKWLQYYYDNLPTHYYISSNGDVFSGFTNKILKQYIVPHTGYHRIELSINDSSIRKYVHVMMMEMFYPVRHIDETQVNHKNGDKSKNTLCNLEWCTPSYNNKHAIITGLKRVHSGENATGAKYTDNDIHETCRLLELGESVSEISRIVGISQGYIRDIRIGKYRQEISSLYDLDRIEKRYINKESKDILNRLISILNENRQYSPKQLCDKLGMEYNNKNRCKIRQYRRKILNQ